MLGDIGGIISDVAGLARSIFGGAEQPMGVGMPQGMPQFQQPERYKDTHSARQKDRPASDTVQAKAQEKPQGTDPWALAEMWNELLMKKPEPETKPKRKGLMTR